MSIFMDDSRRAALAILLLTSIKQKKKRKRSIWSKQWLLHRHKFSHMGLLKELKENNPDDFRNYLRMSDSNFEHLFEAIRPAITKQNTCMRQAISPEQRLIATLRYLATGRTLEDLKFSTGISAQSLGRIIPETCNAIIEAMKAEYLKFPESAEEWKAIAKQFEDYWNFPNCGGAIDGKHVRIQPPANSGSYYYNYKGYFSIVLMAIVNAKYEFIMVDVGKNGRVSDGGAIEQTVFYQKLKNKEVQLPTNNETTEGLNFVFVADEAFALQEHILKPFPVKTLTKQRRIFNYRLSRARRVVENAFGILANRFRVFHTAITLSPAKVDLVVLTCCVLHNFLRRTNGNVYMPNNMVDREDIEYCSLVYGDWRSDPNAMLQLQAGGTRNANVDAKTNRENYVDYFNGQGAVDWQDAMI
ncbi:protein ANTAGONIST OF LIKE HETEROCHROMATIN PROTEIN 1-like [Xenopus laevis]|uniref:Protein ANTAGONIST OF LIKE HETEROCHROMATIN PROTEIN 1-like n=1 Tax=Xenopus laevis TaxID=8355 RepID=A0A8J1KZA3_XENLA|nr:protein ANTAGONIST OF LIKE HETEROCHROMATIN PROTEIN 1-like [Xenopus laevis]XP_041441968.1 protein ANTAGONIST OF LIKE HETEROCHROMATIN PROTEIN 1-like [Xenopus laevis]